LNLAVADGLPEGRVIGFGALPGGDGYARYWIVQKYVGSKGIAIPAVQVIPKAQVADVSGVSFHLIASDAKSIPFRLDDLQQTDLQDLADNLNDQRVAMGFGIRASDRHTVHFFSTPPGATVWVRGKELNRPTELSAWLRESALESIEMRLDGYVPCVAEVVPTGDGNSYTAHCTLVASTSGR
jgi:hypothetical protein